MKSTLIKWAIMLMVGWLWVWSGFSTALTIMLIAIIIISGRWEI